MVRGPRRAGGERESSSTAHSFPAPPPPSHPRFSSTSLSLSLITSLSAHKRRLFDLGGGHSSGSAYTHPNSPAHNPFGGGWTQRGRPRPPPRPPGWLAAAARTVLARSTKGDALAHAAMASLLLFGGMAVSEMVEGAWGIANEGRGLGDALAAVERERGRRRGGEGTEGG